MNSTENTRLARTDELDLPWSYPWQDPDSLAWKLMLNPVATSDEAGTVSRSGHNGHDDPATTGGGAPNMSTTKNQARDYALEMAGSLEERLATGTVEDDGILEDDREDFLDDILEMVADTHGALRVVLTLGGPRAELVLGDGAPRIEVSWGRDRHACQANIDEGFVADFLETWWRPTMEAALEA